MRKRWAQETHAHHEQETARDVRSGAQEKKGREARQDERNHDRGAGESPERIRGKEAPQEGEEVRAFRIYRQVFTETEIMGTLSQVLPCMPVCWTLELPFRGNRVNISCIPEGIYVVKREYSPRWKRAMWTLQSVPGRTDILIGHVGNSYEDTEGCILLGTDVDRHPHGQNLLKWSERACDRFEELTRGVDELQLEIRI